MHNKNKQAFTLIELLTVIAVISLLCAMLFPVLNHAKQRARIVSCANNVKQLALASLLYAQDDAQGSLSGRVEAADQSLNYLFNGYATIRKTFVCPNTKNNVSTNRARNKYSLEAGLADLLSFAASATSPNGMSYMSHAFIGHDTPYTMQVRIGTTLKTLPYLRKTVANIQNYVKWHDSFGLKGITPGPSRHWLIVDSYWAGSTRGYLDNADNHGEKGLNVSFADGHVQWVPRKDFIYLYELDSDEGRTGIPLTY